ncbi:MAG: AAA family ATPase [Polyangiaceae bacterium]
MYERLHVTGFRGLDDVELDGLGRINLLVGQNNTGKTSVLEAILLMGAGDAQMLWTLASLRGLSPKDDPDSVLGTFQTRQERDRIVRIAAKWTGDEKERVFELVASLGLVPAETEDESVARVVERAWIGLSGSYYPASSSAAPVQSDTANPTRAFKLREDFVRSVFVSGRARSVKREVQQYGWLVKSRREGEVLAALKLLDNRIQRVQVVPRGDHAAIFVDLGLPDLYPLAVCGDGVVRMFSFIVELTSVRDGVLLVDEIDAGLHHTVMTEFWKYLLELAERLNVQVFATTHSEDLLRGALSAREGDLEWLRVYRLDRRKGNVVTVRYSPEQLRSVRDDSFEVRG